MLYKIYPVVWTGSSVTTSIVRVPSPAIASRAATCMVCDTPGVWLKNLALMQEIATSVSKLYRKQQEDSVIK